MGNLDVADFSGGMTDNFVTAPLNKFEAADNFVITNDRRLESRQGSGVMDPDVPRLSTEARADSIVKFKGTRYFQSANKLFSVGSGVETEIQGPASVSLYGSGVLAFNQNSYAEWNNHLFMTNDARRKPAFLYKDGSTVSLRTLGLPRITNAEAALVTMSAGTGHSRNYVFVRSQTYSINGVEFTQRSAVSTIKSYFGALPNSIGALPVLVNSGNTHFDTATVKIEIYRTANTGATYYKVGEVTNGTTTFSDSVSDIDLQLNEVIYTDSDELDYDMPPECKFLLQNDGVLFFLNVKDAFGDTYPNMIVQANPDQPYAAPGGNSATVDGDLTGGGVAGQFPVVFTEKRTYRLQGIYDSTGAGGITPVEISRTVGCVSHKSIVQTQDGLFFAARDGYYFTDGYRVVRISEDIPKTYLSLVTTAEQAKRIYGTYDPFNKRVLWSATSDFEKADNDCIFVAHLYFGISPNLPFTRWNGGEWASVFNPASLLYDEDTNELIRGESTGVLLKHSPELVNDLKVDLDAPVSEWIRIPVIYDYKSFATDFGLVRSRKWVTRLIVYADAVGKVTMMPFSQNDKTAVWREMAEIRAGTPLIWGDTDVLWGDSSIRWAFVPIVSANRRFPKQSIRCSYKQIRLRNSLTTIEETKTMGQATFDSVAKTVTIVNPGVNWAVNALDYFVTISSDSFQSRYRIIGRTNTVLTVEDLASTLPSGQFDFKVIGYRIDEAVRLLSFSMIYEPIGPSQTPYKAS
ncbi:MAG: hypothetical protein KF767_08830 [Bdellovibrionaceae bacterium]|nr:hypothetical protein [Pseudobdellovibrionaceae bacterium]